MGTGPLLELEPGLSHNIRTVVLRLLQLTPACFSSYEAFKV
jgi:hypothetical protein